MKVYDVFTPNVKSCTPDIDLAAAARIMWEFDCGAIPIVDANGKVIGMITDRDICMAVATRSKLASEIHVGDVATGEAYCCFPEDEVEDALRTMASHQVRRLPVVDDLGRLQGIVSMNDLILRAQPGEDGVATEEVIRSLKAISAHRAEAEQRVKEAPAIAAGT